MPASFAGLRKRDCADRAYIVQLKGRSLMVDFTQLANKQPPVARKRYTGSRADRRSCEARRN